MTIEQILKEFDEKFSNEGGCGECARPEDDNFCVHASTAKIKQFLSEKLQACGDARVEEYKKEIREKIAYMKDAGYEIDYEIEDALKTLINPQ